VKSSIFGTLWNTLGNLLSSATGKVRHKPTVGFMKSPRICGRKGARCHRPTEACAAENPELRASLQALIRYYSENAGRMRYDEYLRLGYGIGSGAVESAHKQVVHARFRQAGMRWSEAGARRLLALRLLLLNENWALLDRLRMVSLA